jgi:hypothetical protein
MLSNVLKKKHRGSFAKTTKQNLILIPNMCHRLSVDNHCCRDSYIYLCIMNFSALGLQYSISNVWHYQAISLHRMSQSFSIYKQVFVKAHLKQCEVIDVMHQQLCGCLTLELRSKKSPTFTELGTICTHIFKTILANFLRFD